MNCIIAYYSRRGELIDINNSKLFVGDKEYVIQHLTKSGYFSTSLLSPFFEYLETTDGDGGQQCLSITDETADLIIKSNCNLKGRVWRADNEPLYESIVERNEIKYGEFGVSMAGVKGVDY